MKKSLLIITLMLSLSTSFSKNMEPNRNFHSMNPLDSTDNIYFSNEEIKMLHNRLFSIHNEDFSINFGEVVFRYDESENKAYCLFGADTVLIITYEEFGPPGSQKFPFVALTPFGKKSLSVTTDYSYELKHPENGRRISNDSYHCTIEIFDMSVNSSLFYLDEIDVSE